MFFRDWLRSLSIMFPKLIRVVASVRISLLVRAEAYPTVEPVHILVIRSSVDPQLCFEFLVYVRQVTPWAFGFFHGVSCP